MDSSAFEKDISLELENIDRLVKEMDVLMNQMPQEPDFLYIRAAGSILHDFYSGVEKIFERIALFIDKGLPKGEDWHTQLLIQMSKPIKGIREEVIGGDLLQGLKEYLRFRHLFRHIYGFELEWQLFSTLCISMASLADELRSTLDDFFDRS